MRRNYALEFCGIKAAAPENCRQFIYFLLLLPFSDALARAAFTSSGPGASLGSPVVEKRASRAECKHSFPRCSLFSASVDMVLHLAAFQGGDCYDRLRIQSSPGRCPETHHNFASGDSKIFFAMALTSSLDSRTCGSGAGSSAVGWPFESIGRKPQRASIAFMFASILTTPDFLKLLRRRREAAARGGVVASTWALWGAAL